MAPSCGILNEAVVERMERPKTQNYLLVLKNMKKFELLKLSYVIELLIINIRFINPHYN